MIPNPPHLPPKSCSVPVYHRVQFLVWIVIILGISFLAGVASALSTVAWFAPPVIQGQPLFSIDRTNGQDSHVDPLIVQQTRQRVLRLYDTAELLDQTFYPISSLLGEVVMLSTDGWGVLYAPNFSFLRHSSWVGVDSQGTRYAVSEVVRDPFYDFVYIKFAGEGFRIVSFARDVGSQQEADIFSVVFGDWRYHDTQQAASVIDEAAYPLWYAKSGYVINEPVAVPPAGGAILMDREGELAGFLDNDHNVIPLWPVVYQLSSILSEGRVLYMGVPVSGVFISAQSGDGLIESMSGFYITRVDSNQISLRVGDVIVAINGKQFDASTAAQDIFFSGETLSLDVQRDGSKITLTIEPEELVLDN